MRKWLGGGVVLWALSFSASAIITIPGVAEPIAPDDLAALSVLALALEERDARIEELMKEAEEREARFRTLQEITYAQIVRLALDLAERQSVIAELEGRARLLDETLAARQTEI